MPTAIDLFAGAGGFTTGATLAGVDVIWAANHWPEAVHIHSWNHPGTVHACQDLQQANFTEVPAHDILLASPSCTGHTLARGKDRPSHDAARATAWAVVTCTEVHKEKVVIVENVPAFLQWKLYPAWAAAMEALGYAISPHVLDAADHGVPQHRERLFLVCTRSQHPLKLALPRRPHTPVRDVLEWDQHRWNPIHRPGRSEATLRRIAAGRARFGEQFVAPFYKSGSGETGRSLDRPLGTLTTKARWMLVDGDRMRMVQPTEARTIMGFPSSYILPKSKTLANFVLGNAVAPPVVTDLLNAVQEAA
jgi:DNA (cytosine-5)-methyltransferase 1